MKMKWNSRILAGKKSKRTWTHNSHSELPGCSKIVSLLSLQILVQIFNAKNATETFSSLVVELDHPGFTRTVFKFKKMLSVQVSWSERRLSRHIHPTHTSTSGFGPRFASSISTWCQWTKLCNRLVCKSHRRCEWWLCHQWGLQRRNGEVLHAKSPLRWERAMRLCGVWRKTGFHVFLQRWSLQQRDQCDKLNGHHLQPSHLVSHHLQLSVIFTTYDLIKYNFVSRLPF